MLFLSEFATACLQEDPYVFSLALSSRACISFLFFGKLNQADGTGHQSMLPFSHNCPEDKNQCRGQWLTNSNGYHGVREFAPFAMHDVAR
jgi:hypothetical protein